jgi:hypothetical protein
MQISVVKRANRPFDNNDVASLDEALHEIAARRLLGDVRTLDSHLDDRSPVRPKCRRQSPAAVNNVLAGVWGEIQGHDSGHKIDKDEG